MTAASLTALLLACEHQGIAVRWDHLPGDMWGVYSHRERTITLRAGMSQGQEVAALMHEMEHARRGDDGHQPRAVERAIDRCVARTLITPDEYARAEAITGGRDSGAIAVEMGLPRWVVSAYRAELRRVR
ncbi:MAG: hypothetical protein SO046_02815 [Actinomyces urogenitalis]|uniref:hypothetical protein n=1 Tax=Actinomyces urogenitalis TaxID=103621 RepID=UPI002A80E35B|nr:hypothetical protein [Actinomyces urogenitalis]MDY3678137.1 hypothetical protein [Actinomyces urogenitalis]